MTYGLNQRILAQHFNDFVGTSSVAGNPLAAYSSSPASTSNRIGAIWGIGNGQWGWGRTTPAISNVNIGGRVSAENWNSLVTINNNISTRTGTPITDYAPISTGDKIAFLQNLTANITSLNNNRFAAVSKTLTGAVYTNTRATNWNTTIVSRFNCIFNTGELARLFFNTGGEILVRVRHNSNLTLQDQNWNTFLSTNVGDIYIGPTGTRQVASVPGGTIATTRGYWSLDTNLANAGATVFNRVAGPGFAPVYVGNLSCTIKAIRIGATNLSGNADNGNTIQIEVTLADNYTGLGDNIQGNQTVVQIFSNRSTTLFTYTGINSVIPIVNF